MWIFKFNLNIINLIIWKCAGEDEVPRDNWKINLWFLFKGDAAIYARCILGVFKKDNSDCFLKVFFNYILK